MSWFNTLFKKKNVMGNDDHYIMKLCVGEEIYDIEDFNLQFKRDTNRIGFLEGEAYGGIIMCMLQGMPGDTLLRWGTFTQTYMNGEIRVYQKDQPNQQAAFVAHFTDGNCIQFQRKVDNVNHKQYILIRFASRLLEFINDEFENQWR